MVAHSAGTVGLSAVGGDPMRPMVDLYQAEKNPSMVNSATFF